MRHLFVASAVSYMFFCVILVVAYVALWNEIPIPTLVEKAFLISLDAMGVSAFLMTPFLVWDLLRNRRN